MDLNEEERKRKDVLVNRLASDWVNKLGAKLLVQHNHQELEMQREKFRKDIYDGKRYSLNVLKKMNTM